MPLGQQFPSEFLQGWDLRDGLIDARAPVSEGGPADSGWPVKRVEQKCEMGRRQPSRLAGTGSLQQQRTRAVRKNAERRTAGPYEHRTGFGAEALMIGAQLEHRLTTARRVAEHHDSPRSSADFLIVDSKAPLRTQSRDDFGLSDSHSSLAPAGRRSRGIVTSRERSDLMHEPDTRDRRW